MNNDLLLELGCEDLPARYVLPLAAALRDGVMDGFSKRGVAAGAGSIFATPRRIAVLVETVAARQADQNIERLGPALAAALKDGQPTPAALGFAKSCGVEFAALGQKDGKLYFAKSQPGRATVELLSEIFEETLKSMDALMPKRMRWGAGQETFVRPVQWMVCLLGGEVLPLKRFGLQAGNKTYGHRFHAPDAIVLKSPDEYEAKLKAAKVWADFESRKSETRQQIEAEARNLQGAARITEELLDEVTALVEWPVAISGRMEERFMQLPPEVIIATIEHNQRYFPVFDKGGKLLPSFITVSNIQSRDFKQVVAGNERVVRPRLADALFFWEQDLKLPFEKYRDRLREVTYIKDLGTLEDRVNRIQSLCGFICGVLDIASTAPHRAAVLCKNDLATRLVYEFPELQGVMGGHYAKEANEPVEVWRAIREHYLPTQQGTAPPVTPTGQVLALADKADILAGVFALGQKPTASRDPFALRRSALGMLRICIERKLPLDLRALLTTALKLQPAGKRDAKVAAEVWEFVLERFSGLAATDLFKASRESDLKRFSQGREPANFPVAEIVLSVSSIGSASPFDLMNRARAVLSFLELEESARLTSAHKRIRNILKTAGEVVADAEVRPELLKQMEELSLYEALTSLTGRVDSAAKSGAYEAGLRTLAQLQVPVDAFFEKVMVMAPEPELRANRLALLRQLDKLCRSVADISCLPG